jgi:hypothetical protein
MADITDLIKSLIEEVKTLRVENKQLHEEVKCIREEMKTKKRMPKAPVEPRVQCNAVAASSGNRCKCRAKPGKDVCEKHDKPPPVQQASTSENEVPARKKKPRVKKDIKKKEVPVHNHPIGESPTEGVVCELCENHGDIFDPDTADADFEVCEENGQSIEERLRIMLESEGE